MTSLSDIADTCISTSNKLFIFFHTWFIYIILISDQLTEKANTQISSHFGGKSSSRIGLLFKFGIH
jgi:hypothetical protein